MRPVSILTGPETYLDHLGVLSALLEIPLIVTEEKTFQLAKEYYPDIPVSLQPLEALTLEYLATHFDVIFETGKFWAIELKPFFELLFRKTMRFVYCPHGNSDKGHSVRNHPLQDISLIYGDHLRDLATQTGAEENIHRFARTGNYRYAYYNERRSFYDKLAEEKIFSRFKREKPIILYAPTWQDKENPTSFFLAIDRFIEELSSSFNLLIKLHPFLVEDFLPHVLSVLGKYETHPSAQFLTDFPPIYPLLSRTAVYVGDYSSIGYDFLSFDRPLYFLQPKKGKFVSPLRGCGLELPEKENWAEFIQETLKEQESNEARKKVYAYAFGEELPSEEIRANILRALTVSKSD